MMRGSESAPRVTGPIRRWWLILVCGALVGCGPADRRAGPALPFDEEGACPFQCCTYREWTVDWDTDIHADRRDDSPVAMRVTLGQTVQALTGVVSTTKMGRAVAARQVVIGSSRTTVRSDEPIYLIRNVGGGDWKVWINGTIDQQYIPSQGYCTGDRKASDECALRVTDQPESVWWVRVRDRRGVEGWTRDVDHFGNIDSCG
jgi:hypothetical protein